MNEKDNAERPENIDAISNKLRPRNLAAQAGEAITEKARSTGQGLVGMLRDHPPGRNRIEQLSGAAGCITGVLSEKAHESEQLKAAGQRELQRLDRNVHVAETVKAEARVHTPELKAMGEDLRQQVTEQVKETASRAKEEAKESMRAKGDVGGASGGA